MLAHVRRNAWKVTPVILRWSSVGILLATKPAAPPPLNEMHEEFLRPFPGRAFKEFTGESPSIIACVPSSRAAMSAGLSQCRLSCAGAVRRRA